MTGEEIIVTFKEPWYNDYNKRLYTQLSEQMIREEIERVHKEPIITNTAFDMAVDKAFLELLHDNKDLINITNDTRTMSKIATELEARTIGGGLSR